MQDFVRVLNQTILAQLMHVSVKIHLAVMLQRIIIAVGILYD